MKKYSLAATHVPVPLVYVQGVDDSIRPIQHETKSELNETSLKIDIERKLPDITNGCMTRTVSVLEAGNLREHMWWKDTNINSRPWFNVKYVDGRCTVGVSGSPSILSPYRKWHKGELLPLHWMDKYYDHICTVFISFYELKNDESDFLLVNEVNRIKLSFSNTMIKYVCILVNPGNGNTSHLQDVISRIHMSGNSLFVLNGGDNEARKREQTTFIKKLLVGLRQYSNDFFDLQIQKLKKREIKDTCYSQEMFSTRNLIKLVMFEQFKGGSDSTTKMLEYAYDRLLSLDKQLSSNKEEIYQWLDILCLHIVRSTILIDANVAFRKFMFHISTIPDRKEVNNDWFAFQYLWLGNLLKSVSDPSLIPINTMLYPSKTDGLVNSRCMPNPGFIFLQAALFKKKGEIGDGSEVISLLTSSIDAFENSSNFRRVESFIYMLLGEVYFRMENYSMALNNYLVALPVYQRDKWLKIICVLLRNVCQCFIGLGRTKEASQSYIELCTYERDGEYLQALKGKIDGLELVDTNEIGLLDVKGLFGIQVGVKKFENMINDGIDLQLRITSNSKVMAEITIDQIRLDLGCREFLIANDPLLKKGYLQIVNEDGKANLDFDHELCKVLQVHLYPKKVGVFRVVEVELLGHFNDLKFQTRIQITPTIERYFTWYSEDCKHQPIKIHYPSNSFKIEPRIPEIKSSLKYDSVGFIGRQFPITVHFLNADKEPDVVIASVAGTASIADKEIEVVSNTKLELSPNDEGTIIATFDIPQNSDILAPCIVELMFEYEIKEVVVAVRKKIRIAVADVFSWQTELRPVVYPFPDLFKIDAENPGTLPMHTRRWQFRLHLKDMADTMEIEEMSFDIRGPTGVSLTLNSENLQGMLKNGETQIIPVQLDVRIIERSARTIPIDMKCHVKYAVSGLTYDYVVDMYKANLPHVDPRVLVYILQERKDGKVEEVDVVYLLENPTDKIFRYQTNMNPLAGVEIVDYVKTSRINLLPFQQLPLKFTYKTRGKLLPEFTLYDRQYQVFVHASVADDRLYFVDGQLLRR